MYLKQCVCRTALMAEEPPREGNDYYFQWLE